MMTFVQIVFPEPDQWIGLIAALAATLVFSGLGRTVAQDGDLPGLTVLCGWAIVCVVLTLVGTLTSWPLAPAFWATVVIGLALLARSIYYARTVSWIPVRVFLLALPLLVIAAAKAPSEVDSFTHWLPNGAYLLEHDGFPSAGRPASSSAYPGFPYNATFLFYVVGRFAGGFVENAVIVYNAFLLMLFAGLLSWLMRRGAKIEVGAEWTIAALSIIAATLLNPVFVRRIWLTSYSDMATSIVVAFAGIVGWLWIESLVRRETTEFGRALAFGLLLALLVNIKQANPVLVAALVAGTGLIALRDPEVDFRRFAARLPLLIGVPLLLYASWRYHLNETPALHEAKMAAIASWPFHRLPALLGNMANVVLDKSPYFVIAIVATVWAARACFRRQMTAIERLATIVASSFVLYNLFLLFIFIAHFGGYPQSYWRLNTHVGYLVTAFAVYGAASAWHRWGRERFRLASRAMRIFSAGMVAIVLVAETALVGYWRFDLEIPKPLVRAASREFARTLPRDAVLFVVIPGDQGNFSGMMSYYVSRSRTDVLMVPISASEQSLEKRLREVGDRPLYVWTYCPQTWMKRLIEASLEPNRATMLRRHDDGWSVVRVWAHASGGPLTGVYKLFDTSKCREG